MTPRRLLGFLSVLAIASQCSPAFAAGGNPAPAPPPGLPGPPPGAASGFPTPPLPGSTPPSQPAGIGLPISVNVPGPGLVNGMAQLQGSRFSLGIACKASGRVSVSAPSVRAGVMAHAPYVCNGRRASVQLRVAARDARHIQAAGSTIAAVTLIQGKLAEHVSLLLQTDGPRAAQQMEYWSDGGLECNLLGQNEAYLVAPDFTVTPPTTIDVRPWVAWYTAATGWRWLGVHGLSLSRWYRWLATPSGITAWTTPIGALDPWTWAPINVPAGKGLYAIGLFEVVYWYGGHPTYLWRYAQSSTEAGAVSNYCIYP